MPVQKGCAIVRFRSCQFHWKLMFRASAHCMGEEHMLELIISHPTAHADLRRTVQQSPLLPFRWTCSSTGWTCGQSPSDNRAEMCSFKRMIIENTEPSLLCSPWHKFVIQLFCLSLYVCLSVQTWKSELQHLYRFAAILTLNHQITAKPV